MTEKYRSLSRNLRGKVLKMSPETPRGEITYLMGRTHIGTPDKEIVRDIWKRTTKWPLKNRKEATRYALQMMDDNRRIVIDHRL
jgi:hypothetical protein